MSVAQIIAEWDSQSDDPHPWHVESAEGLCRLLGIPPEMTVEDLKDLVDHKCPLKATARYRDTDPTYCDECGMFESSCVCAT